MIMSKEVKDLKAAIAIAQELISKSNDTTTQASEIIETALKQLEAKPEKLGRYKPKQGEVYFYKGGDGTVCQDVWTNHAADQHRYRIRNCLRTRALLELDLKRDLAVADFMDIVEEENAKVGWNDEKQRKSYIIFDYRNNYTKHSDTFSWGFGSELPAISPRVLPAVKARLTTEMINLIFRVGAEWEL